MKCEYCGSRNNNDALDCRQCGAPLPDGARGGFINGDTIDWDGDCYFYGGTATVLSFADSIDILKMMHERGEYESN